MSTFSIGNRAKTKARSSCSGRSSIRKVLTAWALWRHRTRPGRAPLPMPIRPSDPFAGSAAKSIRCARSRAIIQNPDEYPEEPMAEPAVKAKAPEMTTADVQQELTDGFHLVIDALKLNGINTIYGVPGIPITDFGRMAQAAGIRVISFRHEQNAGNAAAIAGFLTKQPGICLTVSAPGFLNGLTALANATTNCFPMILISGSSEREIVDLQQGDYEEMDQLAIAKPLCKAAFRVLHAQDIGIGLARAIRAAVSGRPGGVYLDLPAKLFSQVMDAA